MEGTLTTVSVSDKSSATARRRVAVVIVAWAAEVVTLTILGCTGVPSIPGERRPRTRLAVSDSVGPLADLSDLNRRGYAQPTIGRALYQKVFTFAEALASKNHRSGALCGTCGP